MNRRIKAYKIIGKTFGVWLSSIFTGLLLTLMKFFVSFFLLFFLIGCKQLEEPQKKIIKTEPAIIIKEEEVTSKPSDEIEEDNSKYIFNREYTNQGFALIYNEKLFN